ncbi:MAG: HEPN domain-containing protein [Methanoregula sp.]
MKTIHSIPKSNPNLAKITLSNAYEDLQVSRLLFKNKHYARSIFHLQQSVEKAVKSFGYYSGLFDENIAKNMQLIGHNVTNAYPVSLEQYQKIVEFIKSNPNEDYVQYFLIENFAFFREINRDIDDLLEQIEDNFRLIDKLDLTSDEIIKYLNILEEKSIEAKSTLKLLKSENVSDKIRKEIIEIWKVYIKDEMKILCHKHHTPFLTVEKIIDKECESFTNEGISHAILFVYYQYFAIDPLFYLGILTQHHEQKTRYPNYNKNFNPLEYYDDKNPLIVNYNQIHKFTKEGLKRLEKLFSLEIPSKKTLSGYNS